MPPRKRVKLDAATSTATATPKAQKTLTQYGSTNSGAGPYTFTIPSSTSIPKPIECKTYPTSASPSTTPTTTPIVILTHGASGSITTPSLEHLATGASSKYTTTSFTGPMNLPARTKQFHSVLTHLLSQSKPIKASTSTRIPVILGGRSMGARAAVLTCSTLPSALANQVTAETLILSSYPLISPKGDSRADILLALPETVSVLFITGDRDNMCPIDALQKVRSEMRARSWLLVVKGADHGMGVRPKGMVEKVGEGMGKAAARWVEGRDEEETEGYVRVVDGREVEIVWRGSNEDEGSEDKGKNRSLESMGFKRKRKDPT